MHSFAPTSSLTHINTHTRINMQGCLWRGLVEGITLTWLWAEGGLILMQPDCGRRSVRDGDERRRCCPLPCGDVYPNESGESSSVLILRPRCLPQTLHWFSLLWKCFLSSCFWTILPHKFQHELCFLAECHDDEDGENEAGDDWGSDDNDCDIEGDFKDGAGDKSGGDNRIVLMMMMMMMMMGTTVVVVMMLNYHQNLNHCYHYHKIVIS